MRLIIIYWWKFNLNLNQIKSNNKSYLVYVSHICPTLQNTKFHFAGRNIVTVFWYETRLRIIMYPPPSHDLNNLNGWGHPQLILHVLHHCVCTTKLNYCSNYQLQTTNEAAPVISKQSSYVHIPTFLTLYCRHLSSEYTWR